jgi:hypothetical protein
MASSSYFCSSSGQMLSSAITSSFSFSFSLASFYFSFSLHLAVLVMFCCTSFLTDAIS